jgi:pilus assembly protein Flp/PilA
MLVLRIWELYSRMQGLLSEEDGQDLIEYALVVALVALGAVAGMRGLAGDINNAFGTIGNTLNNSI